MLYLIQQIKKGNQQVETVEDMSKISVDDFKNNKNGVAFVKSCIQSSMSSMYEDGAYYFRFSVDDGSVLFEEQPEQVPEDTFSVFVDVDNSILEGCESIEDFENLPEHQEDFNAICENLYRKAVEIVNNEI
jgi:hypothetical protein